MTESAAAAALDPHQAFERHVLPEVEVLYRVARSMTRHHADAEDLVQDTLLRAYRAIERFDGRHPRAWLMTIMRNAQINRTRRRRPGLLADPDVEPEVHQHPSDHGPGAEQVAMDRRFDAVLEEAYLDLPEQFRQVVELVDLGGLAYQEAAEVLEVPVGTVMSRLHRGRGRLRSALESAGVDVVGPRRGESP